MSSSLHNKSSIYKNSSRKEYVLTSEQRDKYREVGREARLAKSKALLGLHERIHKVNKPRFDPNLLMPQLAKNDLRALSLFSGGGGLDLGFDRAGYKHVASYELIPVCKETLLLNHPYWNVKGGLSEGDVTKVDWKLFKEEVDIVHGGPPCQPFSIAGEQQGYKDERNMWGEFSRAVNAIKPKAFIAENVLGLLSPKFEGFIKKYILNAMSGYSIVKFEMHAADYGVPQIRRRVFFVGFRYKKDMKKFCIPSATHSWTHLGQGRPSITLPFLEPRELPKTFGVRSALGLPSIAFDNLAPTIRSGFTGKRNTTSVLNSSAGQKSWGDMEIWPNGVQANREKASNFPAKNKHFRMSIDDIALIQGFPDTWKFAGAVYQQLGQIGNSVAPPVAYQVAKKVREALT